MFWEYLSRTIFIGLKYHLKKPGKLITKLEMKIKFNRNQKCITPWDIQISSLTSLLKANARILGNRVYKPWNYGYTYFKDASLNNLTKNIIWNHDFFVGDYWLWISSTKNTVKSAQNKFKRILCVSLFFPVKLLYN